MCVCLSGSNTFLVVKHNHVLQATHAFLGMLPLFFFSEVISFCWEYLSVIIPIVLQLIDLKKVLWYHVELIQDKDVFSRLELFAEVVIFC